MNHLTTDLIEALAQKQNIEEVFRHHLETAINQLLKHELTVFLDYEPYDREGFHSGNSRNGYYDRTFKTEYGELHLRIPRDRNGQFQQQTIAPYKRSKICWNSLSFTFMKKGLRQMKSLISSIECMDITIPNKRFRTYRNLFLKTCSLSMNDSWKNATCAFTWMPLTFQSDVKRLKKKLSTSLLVLRKKETKKF